MGGGGERKEGGIIFIKDNSKSVVTALHIRKLEKARNLKMIFCYVRKPCSVVSIVGHLSITPKRKNCYRFLNWKVRLVSFFC